MESLGTRLTVWFSVTLTAEQTEENKHPHKPLMYLKAMTQACGRVWARNPNPPVPGFQLISHMQL